MQSAVDRNVAALAELKSAAQTGNAAQVSVNGVGNAERRPSLALWCWTLVTDYFWPSFRGIFCFPWQAISILQQLSDSKVRPTSVHYNRALKACGVSKDFAHVDKVRVPLAMALVH